jgi:hypothetical protein
MWFAICGLWFVVCKWKVEEKWRGISWRWQLELAVAVERSVLRVGIEFMNVAA